jgi:hypothetical protein
MNLFLVLDITSLRRLRRRRRPTLSNNYNKVVFAVVIAFEINFSLSWTLLVVASPPPPPPPPPPPRCSSVRLVGLVITDR